MAPPLFPGTLVLFHVLLPMGSSFDVPVFLTETGVISGIALMAYIHDHKPITNAHLK